MAQYKTGTVSVTNGSATVTGSGTLWSGEIAAGDLFTIVGDNAWYEVASVGSNTSITLSANYAGTTGSGQSYAISRDFTTRLGLPYPQKGDIETASIIKRAFEQIDTETNIATANYSATAAPTVNDDSADGYSIGSWWVNVTTDEAYLCVDATAGAAVWTKISVDFPSEIVALLAGQSVSMASLTLSGGTANGVLYLNGSKVATSGSALTFDGTTFGIGIGGASAGLLRVWSGSNDRRIQLSNNGTVSIINSTYGSAGASPLTFQISDDEQMRLTSTGLGIGTSSPGYKLQVTTASSGAVSRWNYTGGSRGARIELGLTETAGGAENYIDFSGTSGTSAGIFKASGVEVMRLDSSGNFIHKVNGTAPTLSTNSTMSFELTSNTSLKIVVRGTDGTTRSATLVLV